jgi:Bacterial extracellular solute-binding protein/von Willebrand factor type A domain
MGAGSHAMRAEKRAGLGAAIGILLLVVGGLAAFMLTRPDDSNKVAGCGDATTVTVAVAPDIAPVIEKAAAALSDDCTTYQVSSTTSDQVVSTLVAGKAEGPQLWIPDSAGWLAQVEAQGVTVTPLAGAVASSPVVLVGGPAADEPASWLAAFASGRVTMRDPLSTGAGALGLASLRAEQAGTGASDDEIGEVLVPVAQRFSAARASAGAVDPVSRLSTTSVELVPSTEQAYVAAKRDNAQLTAVVPATGTLLQTYPMVAAEGTPAEVVRAGRALASYLTEGEGRALVTQAGFREPAAAPLASGLGVGKVTVLPAPPLTAVAGDLRQWLVLSVPSSLLAVVDVSGSMDFETPDGSRIELAAEAARAALGVFTGAARIGLWAFSIDQGGKGTDYRELVPLRQLDSKVGNRTQRDVLASQTTRLIRMTTGGTGLYDTALAAYRRAVESYDPTYFNSVVLMTDGANDDPGSLRLTDLLRQLKDASDPTRPVRIIAVGISGDADMAALTKIAQATNGAAYPVGDPRDILAVLSQALLGR